MVRCKIWTFSIPNDVAVEEVLATFRMLEKRGAFFIHISKGVWQINVPRHLDYAPFFETLSEDDCVDWISPNLKDVFVPVPEGKDLWA